MINFDDFYTQCNDISLTPSSRQGKDGQSAIGSVRAEYKVRQLRDVRNLSSGCVYQITCKQRIVIPNATAFSPAVKGSLLFDGYPAMLTSTMTVGTAARLIDYAPRTINTTVSSSSSQNDGTTQTTSRQQTVGSSISQTNSFSTSLSAGMSEAGPSLGMSIDQGHSTTVESNRSQSSGLDRGVDRQLGTSNSMSIKDWASFTYLDPASMTPTWVWTQEYPWDILQYRYSAAGNFVKLPDFVICRLFDNPKAPTQAFPPSQLSLFGIDFVMTATWDVELPSDINQQIVSVGQAIQYTTASHGIDQGSTYASLSSPQSFDVDPIPLDLTLLGLDPLRDGQVGNGAVVGFAAGKFLQPPVNGGRFKILSDANNVEVIGTGFDDVMTTTFKNGPVTLRVSFKVSDLTTEYSLLMKHWTAGDAGCNLSFVINGDQSNTVSRRVDAAEGAGADGNMTEVALRNLDYTSIDFHDFLKIGMNTVEIAINSDAGSQTVYVLRAMAIGSIR